MVFLRKVLLGRHSWPSSPVYHALPKASLSFTLFPSPYPCLSLPPLSLFIYPPSHSPVAPFSQPLTGLVNSIAIRLSDSILSALSEARPIPIFVLSLNPPLHFLICLIQPEAPGTA